jgi:sRNA-binding protein
MANSKTRIERNIAELVAAFPLAFSTEPKQIKPLGIGIKQRIYERCILSHREVGDALRRYTGRAAYLNATIEGAVRVDLDGATSGYVTAEEAMHATEQAKKIFAVAVDKLKDEIKQNTPAKGTTLQPSTMSALKRDARPLGLADLKKAAAARQNLKGRLTPNL